MDFETILKVIMIAVAAVGIPVGAYAAIAATRSIWGRPGSSSEKAGDPAELAALRARLAELEPLEARMAELEERLDFAERMLVQQREADRLPAGRKDLA
ncbi:MAG TPA: hypothetical protein VLD58_07625 [Gemmatimonadales bacterium]|nr:hypothetical protein [Gemmatimonadales bacterium]